MKITIQEKWHHHLCSSISSHSCTVSGALRSCRNDTRSTTSTTLCSTHNSQRGYKCNQSGHDTKLHSGPPCTTTQSDVMAQEQPNNNVDIYGSKPKGNTHGLWSTTPMTQVIPSSPPILVVHVTVETIHGTVAAVDSRLPLFDLTGPLDLTKGMEP